MLKMNFIEWIIWIAACISALIYVWAFVIPYFARKLQWYLAWLRFKSLSKKAENPQVKKLMSDCADAMLDAAKRVKF